MHARTQVTAELCANPDSKNGDGTALALKGPPCGTCRSPVWVHGGRERGEAQGSREKRRDSEMVSWDDSAKASQDWEERTTQRRPEGVSSQAPSCRACSLCYRPPRSSGMRTLYGKGASAPVSWMKKRRSRDFQPHPLSPGCQSCMAGRKDSPSSPSPRSCLGQGSFHYFCHQCHPLHGWLWGTGPIQCTLQALTLKILLILLLPPLYR